MSAYEIRWFDLSKFTYFPYAMIADSQGRRGK